MSGDGSIICVGLCCIDLVAKSNRFPIEDTDERIPSINWCLGGNAAHNAMVLKALEYNTVYFAGVLPKSESSNRRFIDNEFSKHLVDTSLSNVEESTSECPISMVIVNSINCSRTILHCQKNFPEFSFGELWLQDILEHNVTWIHFEGRYNVNEISAILNQVKKLNLETPDKMIRTSVELEKCQSEFDALFTNVHVVFMSKEFSQYHGATDKVSAVELFRRKVDIGATVICAWGVQGCAGVINSCDTSEAEVVTADAVSPGQVVDTLGAGDTFVASCIHGFRRGWPLDKTLRLASALAGEKCTQPDGFDRLTDWATTVVGSLV